MQKPASLAFWGKCTENLSLLAEPKLTNWGGIIHSDLVEMNILTPSGKRYYAIFKDDLTGFKNIYIMKHAQV